MIVAQRESERLLLAQKLQQVGNPNWLYTSTDADTKRRDDRGIAGYIDLDLVEGNGRRLLFLDGGDDVRLSVDVPSSDL